MLLTINQNAIKVSALPNVSLVVTAEISIVPLGSPAICFSFIFSLLSPLGRILKMGAWHPLPGDLHPSF